MRAHAVLPSFPMIDAAYRAIFDGASDAIFVSDSEGRFLDANPAACALLGYSRQELSALRIEDVVAPGDLERAPLRHAEVAAGASLRTRRRLVTKAGGVVTTEIATSNIGEGRLLAVARDVTAGERLEQALRESEATLRELTEHLPAVTWIRCGRTGVLLYANAAWQRYLGRAPRLGGHFSELFSTVHPDDLELAHVRTRAAEAGVPYHDTVRFLLPDGTTAWMDVRAFPVRDAAGAVARVCGVAVDVTALRAAGDAAREQERKYATIFEQAPVGLFRTRLDDSAVLEVNQCFCDVFRGGREDFVGTPAAQWWSVPAERDALVAELQRSGVLKNVEVTMRARDGTPIHALVSATVYPHLGYMEGSVVDITERVRAESTVRRALAEKDVLLREIHHRVKNNLQVVSSLLFLQASRIEDAGFQNLYRSSQMRITAMALVHQMLYESADLAHLRLDRYVEALGRALLESHGIAIGRIVLEVQPSELTLDLDAAVPCGLLLHEILSNAIKHAFPAGRRGRVRVAIEHCEDRLCRLEVTDDGVGLPQDVLDREHAALGSKLVARLVGQMRGSMRRESSSAGTRYEILFPCSGAHQESPPGAAG